MIRAEGVLIRFGRVAGVAMLAAATACGCGGGAIVLQQPSVAGAEQSLRMVASDAWFSQTDDGPARFLATLPLPGARNGRNFLIYFRSPGLNGSWAVGDDLPGGGRVGGFLIQLTGARRGLTGMNSGRLEVSGVLAAPSTRRIRVEVTCEDGTVITGEFTARRDDLTLRDFEEGDRPDDVRMLVRTRAGRPGPGERASAEPGR